MAKFFMGQTVFYIGEKWTVTEIGSDGWYRISSNKRGDEFVEQDDISAGKYVATCGECGGTVRGGRCVVCGETEMIEKILVA